MMHDHATGDGIYCARKGCLASYTWMGGGVDGALESLADASGWQVYADGSWRCPKHLLASAETGS